MSCASRTFAKSSCIRQLAVPSQASNLPLCRPRPACEKQISLHTHSFHTTTSHARQSGEKASEAPRATRNGGANADADQSRRASALEELRRGTATNTLPPNNKPQQYIQKALTSLAKERGLEIPYNFRSAAAEDMRMPRSVQALYLAPLRHQAIHKIVCADLQLRSYSVRNLEFMADFALRAAYYLGLPAKGPVPLPRITQRFTMQRDLFIFKKAKENWERVTLRRLVQIQDGDPEVVQRWLAFVRKWSWYGVGMKANVYENEGMNALEQLSTPSDEAMQAGMESVDWDLIVRKKGLEGAKETGDWLERRGFGAPLGGRRNPKATASGA